MGHDVLACLKCGTYIMEGHNDWECTKCNMICNESTKWSWKKK